MGNYQLLDSSTGQEAFRASALLAAVNMILLHLITIWAASVDGSGTLYKKTKNISDETFRANITKSYKSRSILDCAHKC